ncbi:hypothetical protein LTR66_001880 [Elasticomyces elasticus]|nr:hypothetical protein LTR66_001880 [Elasticomyces elasticus]
MNSLKEGAVVTGESGRQYLLVAPMTSVKPGIIPNVWSAVDAQSQDKIYVIKQPQSHENNTYWPEFQQEMVMHQLFKGCSSIRQQIDQIPPNGFTDPPRIVLEAMENTIWSARISRPMTTQEVKVIMRGTLVGLREIHTRGLVYADLKMQNIFVDGFRATPEETNVDQLVAKIGDLGIVMEPTAAKVQPIAYRSPEVYFKSQVTTAADIWSWGIIYCHLLEAQAHVEESGMYDAVAGNSVTEIEYAVKEAMFDDFDLGNVGYYQGWVQPSQNPRNPEDHWAQRLLRKGLPKAEIDFLVWVLNPDPSYRPGAEEILNHAWLREARRGSTAVLERNASYQTEAKKANGEATITVGTTNETAARPKAMRAHSSDPEVNAKRPRQAAAALGEALAEVTTRDEYDPESRGESTQTIGSSTMAGLGSGWVDWLKNGPKPDVETGWMDWLKRGSRVSTDAMSLTAEETEAPAPSKHNDTGPSEKAPTSANPVSEEAKGAEHASPTHNTSTSAFSPSWKPNFAGEEYRPTLSSKTSAYEPFKPISSSTSSTYESYKVPSQETPGVAPASHSSNTSGSGQPWKLNFAGGEYRPAFNSTNSAYGPDRGTPSAAPAGHTSTTSTSGFDQSWKPNFAGEEYRPTLSSANSAYEPYKIPLPETPTGEKQNPTEGEQRPKFKATPSGGLMNPGILNRLQSFQ